MYTDFIENGDRTMLMLNTSCRCFIPRICSDGDRTMLMLNIYEHKKPFF